MTRDKARPTWERLRHDLLRLGQQTPNPLRMYPTPDPVRPDGPPYDIQLAANAEAVAAELHEAYGEFVALHVGALPYPPRSAPPRRRRDEQRELADPRELRAALDGPLTVRSGETVMHALLVTSTGEQAISIHTNGQITATIVDQDGSIVGGYSDAQHQPLILFTAAPGQTVRVPLLVGTASYKFELGYTVPPGSWQLVAPLDLADRRRLRTPPLPLTVTS